MISNLCKKISRLCCCFKTSILDTQDNEDYNAFDNNVIVTDEKFPRTLTSISCDNRYSLSNEAFNYSDIYR